MGRADLIDNGKHHLIPTFQPLTDGNYSNAQRKNSTVTKVVATAPVKGRHLTQHTGLPPRVTGGANHHASADAFVARSGPLWQPARACRQLGRSQVRFSAAFGARQSDDSALSTCVGGTVLFAGLRVHQHGLDRTDVAKVDRVAQTQGA